MGLATLVAILIVIEDKRLNCMFIIISNKYMFY